MKVELIRKVAYDARYLVVDAVVRHWEDGRIDGIPDISDGVSVPRVPCAYKKDGEWRWMIRIDLDRGVIDNWHKGTTAGVHYKVYDDCTYTLLDGDCNVIAQTEDYVPNFIGVFGDFIKIDIDAEGVIKGFRCTGRDLNELFSEDEEY